MQNKVNKGGRFRLIERRERWGLTLGGWLAALIVALVMLLIGIFGIHGFLAGENPVRGKILVVEGWIPDYAMSGAVSEFKENGYELMIAAGSPITLGSHVSGFRNYAELAHVRLKALGVDERRIVVLETMDITKDRTYQSARAVQRWFSLNRTDLKGLDVYTLGAHTRRSRLLFKKVFGNGVNVGVIAAKDQSYDPERWWKSSNGARTVLSELIGYLYAAVFRMRGF